MAPGGRAATRAASDEPNPTHQQLEGDGSREPSGSRTVDNEGSTEPANGPGERHAPLIPSEVAARSDPEFLQLYYDAYARVQRGRMEEELEQMDREEADDSRRSGAKFGGVQCGPPKETSFRLSKPVTYSAKDEKEGRGFINWWKVIFMKNPEAWSEGERIANATVGF
jgi:hypothetical protein